MASLGRPVDGCARSKLKCLTQPRAVASERHGPESERDDKRSDSQFQTGHQTPGLPVPQQEERKNQHELTERQERVFRAKRYYHRPLTDHRTAPTTRPTAAPCQLFVATPATTPRTMQPWIGRGSLLPSPLRRSGPGGVHPVYRTPVVAPRALRRSRKRSRDHEPVASSASASAGRSCAAFALTVPRRAQSFVAKVSPDAESAPDTGDNAGTMSQHERARPSAVYPGRREGRTQEKTTARVRPGSRWLRERGPFCGSRCARAGRSAATP